MCVGTAILESELPTALVDAHVLAACRHQRFKDSDEREIWFLWRDRRPRLPVWHEGRLKIVDWGNRRHPRLPKTGWTWRESVEAGRWAGYGTEPVDIPATFGLENGVWYKIEQGIRGLLVQPPDGPPVVYMICDPATRYYQVMTRSTRMPVLIEQVI